MIEHIPQAPHLHQSCVFRTKERPNPRFSPVSTRFLPASQILHSLEESVRRRPPQRPKSSRHWRKIDAHEPLSGKNPPPTGRKWTHIGSPSGKNPPDTGRISTPQTTPATQILQTLEESVRSQDRQRGDCSSGWKNWGLGRTEPNLGGVYPNCSNKKGLPGAKGALSKPCRRVRRDSNSRRLAPQRFSRPSL